MPFPSRSAPVFLLASCCFLRPLVFAAGPGSTAGRDPGKDSFPLDAHRFRSLIPVTVRVPFVAPRIPVLHSYPFTWIPRWAWYRFPVSCLKYRVLGSGLPRSPKRVRLFRPASVWIRLFSRRPRRVSVKFFAFLMPFAETVLCPRLARLSAGALMCRRCCLNMMPVTGIGSRIPGPRRTVNGVWTDVFGETPYPAAGPLALWTVWIFCRGFEADTFSALKSLCLGRLTACLRPFKAGPRCKRKSGLPDKTHGFGLACVFAGKGIRRSCCL